MHITQNNACYRHIENNYINFNKIKKQKRKVQKPFEIIKNEHF